MNGHHHVNNAKAVVGLLVLAVAFVLFYKFITNQSFFFDDIEALRNYVVFTIAVCGFLIGLLYLSSQTTHKIKSVVKSSPKSTKKKKK
jgi:H+/Cl- antiporter ClcA